MKAIPRGRSLALIAVSAFVIRVFVLVAFDATIILDDWHFGYETGRIARSLAQGEGFGSPFKQSTGPTAWLMPAYPALLATVFEACGVYSQTSAIVILLFNCSVSALTCVAVYRLAEAVFDTKPGLLAALVFAVYPPSIWHAVNTIWDTTLLALVVTLLIHGICGLDKGCTQARAAALGLALGSSLWLSPIVLALIPLFWFQLLRCPRHSRLWRISAAVVFTIATLAVISPWMLRNYQVFGIPFLRSNLGLELRLGNSARAWNHYVERNSSSLFSDHPSTSESEFRRYVELGEVRYVDEAFDEAIRFIRANPKKFLRLCLWRLGVFWLSDLQVPNEWAGNLSVAVSLSWMRTASHLLPLPFVIAGLVVGLRRKRRLWPLVGALALFPIPYYLTHVSERYRYPIEPAVVVVASYGLYWLLHRILRVIDARRSRPAEVGLE